MRGQRVEGLLLNLAQHATKHERAAFRLRSDVDQFETAPGVGHDALHIGKQPSREMEEIGLLPIAANETRRRMRRLPKGFEFMELRVVQRRAMLQRRDIDGDRPIRSTDTIPPNRARTRSRLGIDQLRRTARE